MGRENRFRQPRGADALPDGVITWWEPTRSRPPPRCKFRLLPRTSLGISRSRQLGIAGGANKLMLITGRDDSAQSVASAN